MEEEGKLFFFYVQTAHQYKIRDYSEGLLSDETRHHQTQLMNDGKTFVGICDEQQLLFLVRKDHLAEGY